MVHKIAMRSTLASAELEETLCDSHEIIIAIGSDVWQYLYFRTKNVRPNCKVISQSRDHQRKSYVKQTSLY